MYDLDDRLVKSVTCTDYFATGSVQTPLTCVIEHVPTKVRGTITVREVAYDVDLRDDLFSVTHLGE
jgi:hypothetical protein